jgi:hypothetical protein
MPRRFALLLAGMFALAGVVAGLVLLTGDGEVSDPIVGETKTASADSTGGRVIASRRYDDPLRKDSKLRCATFVEVDRRAARAHETLVLPTSPDCSKPDP